MRLRTTTWEIKRLKASCNPDQTTYILFLLNSKVVSDTTSMLQGFSSAMGLRKEAYMITSLWWDILMKDTSEKYCYWEILGHWKNEKELVSTIIASCELTDIDSVCKACQNYGNYKFLTWQLECHIINKHSLNNSSFWKS